MAHAQDDDFVAFDCIDNQVLPEAHNRQHAYARLEFRATHRGKFGETCDRAVYLSDNGSGCSRIMAGNAGKDLSKNESSSAPTERCRHLLIGGATPLFHIVKPAFDCGSILVG
jgi:hypothetical protein